MDILLFVLSLTAVINYFIKVLSCICGHSMAVPFPILHLLDWGFSNTYISTPAIMYQVYFWATYLELFVA